ncbi:unnamed protein product, partial [Nesidiocoris tenuis]
MNAVMNSFPWFTPKLPNIKINPQSNFGVQHSHMDPTVSTATGENASRLFRPWDSTAPSTAKVEEKSEK